MVLAYLAAVLTMGVNDEEQCDGGGAAGDDNDDDRQGDGSKLFGVGGRGGFDEDGQQRRVEEVCRWAGTRPSPTSGTASVLIPCFAGPCS